ncbi:alpha/beta fold hydrolase [Nonomuraea phyllanthi]|nr:alpha/beta fold hydrolase [Nonomuraea phyllanthi]
MVSATATTAALGTLLMGSLAAGTPAVAELDRRPAVVWRECPEYSDDELRSRGLREEELAAFRQLLGRTECGTLAVPLDYADPGGQQISIALTRLKATDQEHRLGSMVLNPGGPGGSGYLMPLELAVKGAGLGGRYDLIGFDPRGVGRSTKVACADGQGDRRPGPVTEAWAREVYAETAERNRECAASDPAFLGQLTTANVARDIDRIRAALDERKISFFGVSWGTWLGAVLRSLFPGKVERMWLDSVAPPTSRTDRATELRAGATDREFRRMAAWIADRDGTYGLGTSREQVMATVEKLRRSFDAEPLTFSDLDLTVDGAVIADVAGRPGFAWPDVAQLFKELLTAEGPSAPPAVRKVLGGPPSGAAASTDRTANRAFHCNEDQGSRSFEAAWNAYRKRMKRYPVTGRATPFVPMCAGWPLPVQETRLRGGGSLMLSGHLYETLSPYEGTVAMHEAIGGTLVTIDDDVHGSAIRTPGCAAKIVDYFETGRRTRTCPGAPLPASTETPGRG